MIRIDVVTVRVESHSDLRTGRTSNRPDHMAPKDVSDASGKRMTETGYLVAGRYHVADLIAVGGMPEVRRGRDLRLGREVAVKILRADLADDLSLQARFRREAQNACSLNHSAIVAVDDTGETTAPAARARTGASPPPAPPTSRSRTRSATPRTAT